MPAYEVLAGDTYYVRGSPSTVAYDGGGALYIVDPGHGSGKLKSVQRLVRDLSRGRPVVAVITHYHSDHLELVARRPGLFTDTAASRIDASGVESPRLRVAATFGYPLGPDTPFLPFRAPPVRVSLLLEPGQPLGPLTTVHLPGHTPGQIGVATPDGVLYAGDAVFGDRVLERYQLPYHLDPCGARESLRRLMGLDWEVLVPGHGPVLPRGEALGLIERNIEAIDTAVARVEEALRGLREAGLHEIASRVLRPGEAGGPGMYMLLEQTLRGLLACLAEQGAAEPVLGEEGLRWAYRG